MCRTRPAATRSGASARRCAPSWRGACAAAVSALSALLAPAALCLYSVRSGSSGRWLQRAAVVGPGGGSVEAKRSGGARSLCELAVAPADVQQLSMELILPAKGGDVAALQWRLALRLASSGLQRSSRVAGGRLASAYASGPGRTAATVTAASAQTPGACAAAGPAACATTHGQFPKTPTCDSTHGAVTELLLRAAAAQARQLPDDARPQQRQEADGGEWARRCT